MSDTKLSALTGLGTVATGDYLYILDSSDTTDSSSGSSRKITVSNLLAGQLLTNMSDVTATATEVNVLDGIPSTLTYTELGYVDGVTSAIQTQMDLKAPLVSPTLVTPTLGVATATSINKVLMIRRTPRSTLTLITGSSLITAGAYAITLTSTNTTGVTLPTTGTLATLAGTETLSGKSLTKPIINGTNPTGATYTPATGAQTVALDCAANNMHIVNGHADGTAITFTVANATNNQPFIVSILQGAVVSTITGWFATVRWAGGSTPTLTATVTKRDTFGFIRTGAAQYDGFVIGQNC